MVFFLKKTEIRGLVSSFVQTRGSIPFFWGQDPKELKPKPVVKHSLFTKPVVKNHFDRQKKIYSKVVAVNLIDQEGDEAALGNEFERQMRLMDDPDLRYVAFDFHARCHHNHYENLAQLLTEVRDDLDKFSYFWKDTTGVKVLEQKGVFRTNCIDCLDRTNVVQALFAKYMLVKQLANVGIISSDEHVDEHYPEFSRAFKNVWADNADRMSEQYTGTGALKTDFTRTGKRTAKGVANDGLNSMKRYLIQLQDDARQLSFDLFLGRVRVGTPPFLTNEDMSTHRFKAVFTQNGESVDATFDINVRTRKITRYLPESKQKVVYSLDALKLIEKSPVNYKQLSLWFENEHDPMTFMLTTTAYRQQFLEVLDRVTKILQIAESNSKAKFSCTLYCQSMGKDKAPLSLEALGAIPLGHSSLYVLLFHNCSYKVSKEYYWREPKDHVLYVVQKYFGPKYHCAASTVAFPEGYLVLVVLIHEEHLQKVSSMKVSEVMKESKKKKPAIKSPLPIFGNVAHHIGKIGGTSTDTVVIGTALSFRYYDSHFCFLGTSDKYDRNMPECVVKVKDFNVANTFNNSFWLGSVSKNINTGPWNIINQSQDEFIFGRALPWATLPAANSSPPSQSGHALTLQSRITLSATKAPPMETTKFKILLLNLRLEKLDPVQSARMVAPYFVFHAPFIEGIFQTKPARTKIAAWPGVLEMSALFSRKFCSNNFLRVDMWNGESSVEKSYIGSGTIPLNGIDNVSHDPASYLEVHFEIWQPGDIYVATAAATIKVGGESLNLSDTNNDFFAIGDEDAVLGF